MSHATSCDIYLSYWTFGPPDYRIILIAYLNEFPTDSETDYSNVLIAYVNELGTDSQTDYSNICNNKRWRLNRNSEWRN